jgi:hypothetical protein
MSRASQEILNEATKEISEISVDLANQLPRRLPLILIFQRYDCRTDE